MGDPHCKSASGGSGPCLGAARCAAPSAALCRTCRADAVTPKQAPRRPAGFENINSGRASDADSERAIRGLIALMVLTCDPLAIALTAAASAQRQGRSGRLAHVAPK